MTTSHKLKFRSCQPKHILTNRTVNLFQYRARLSADILIVLADAIRKFSNILIVFSDLLIGQIERIELVGGQLYSDLDFKPFSQPQNKNFVYKIKAATSEEVAA